MSSSYVPEEYVAPDILLHLQNLLVWPRQEYSSDFAQFIDFDSAGHESYKDGLVFVGAALGACGIFWISVLMVLKLKGKDSGCASGHPVREDFDYEDGRFPSGGSTASMLDDEVPSNSFFQRRSSQRGRNAATRDDDESFHSSLPSDNDDESYDSRPMNMEDFSVESLPLMPARRERRVRIALFFFGFTTIGCLVMLLLISFRPLLAAISTGSESVDESREVIAEVSASFKAISSATKSALDIVDALPLAYELICPAQTSVALGRITGFDLDTMVQQFSTDYSVFELEITKQSRDVGGILDRFGTALDVANTISTETNNYIWLVPGVLLGICTVTVAAMFASYLAWKRKSNRRFQRFVANVILPLFILLSFICWMGAGITAISTAITSDACLSGVGSGSPKDTIHRIVDVMNVSTSSTLYEFVVAYSEGCVNGDPAAELSRLEGAVQILVDELWQHLSMIDSAGRSYLREVCGEGNKLESFLSGSRDLAKLLSSIRRALDSSAASLQCERVHAIYDDAINTAVCHDIAGASAWALLLLVALGVSSMSMISLRSSWWYEIDDDKIYDESEVAENMIVDEHEEYLDYISKYKHEWEEYRGIDSSVPKSRRADCRNDDNDASSRRSESESELYPSSQTSMESGPCSIHDFPTDEQDTLPDHRSPCRNADSKPQAFDPYTNSPSNFSTSTGDISFQSLQGEESPTQTSEGAGIFVMPPPLLLRASFKEGDEEVDGIPPPIVPKQILTPSRKRVYDDTEEMEIRFDHGDMSLDLGSSKLEDTFKKTVSEFLGTRNDKLGQSTIPSAPPASEDMWESRPSPSKRRSSEAGMGFTDDAHDGRAPMRLSLGTSSPRIRPARLSLGECSPGSVKFQLSPKGTESYVKIQVDRFSKTKRSVARPGTPPHKPGNKLKDLASKYDSPASKNNFFFGSKPFG